MERVNTLTDFFTVYKRKIFCLNAQNQVIPPVPTKQNSVLIFAGLACVSLKSNLRFRQHLLEVRFLKNESYNDIRVDMCVQHSQFLSQVDTHAHLDPCTRSARISTGKSSIFQTRLITTTKLLLKSHNFACHLADLSEVN